MSTASPLNQDAQAPSVVTTLQQWLSINSLISRDSATALQHQEAAEERNDDSPVFRSIGRGFCAEIFHQPGTRHVFKSAFRPQDRQLWNDFQWHARVLNSLEPAFNRSRFDLSIPLLYSYTTRSNEAWWSKNCHKWPRDRREPTDLLGSQRILPLPKIVRHALIDEFCPPGLQAAAKTDPVNRDCLMRVYLGRRHGYSANPAGNFSLRNFEADLQIFDQLGLSQEPSQHARVMAFALALMHWSVGTNAADVEFVLGSTPANRPLKYAEIQNLPPHTDIGHEHRPVHMWLLDFNQCGAISKDEAGVVSAVDAFWQNDPYYPRPVPPADQDFGLWEVFRDEYLERSREILGEEVGLAEGFVGRVVEEAERRQASVGGPPRGGLPGKNSGGRQKGRGARDRPDILETLLEN